MRNLFVFLFVIVTASMHARSSSEELNTLLEELDVAMSERESVTIAKEARIEELRKKKQTCRTIEELYWLNKMFYDEYFVYNADSAMTYVEKNLEITEKQQNYERQAEWMIKKSFLLSATGLLKEALDILQLVNVTPLSSEVKVEYYSQMIYLYSHFGLYSGDDNPEISARYYGKERLYKDSIYETIRPEDPLYLWHLGWYLLGTGKTVEIRKQLMKKLENSSLETRQDAMNAYILSYLCRESGEKENYLKYLVLSSIADVRAANKDIASLEELAKVLFEMGDIDRAYTYINYCLESAQLYRNRVRVVAISATQEAIHQAYQERSRRQDVRLHLSLVVVSILSIVLLVAVFYILRQMKHISLSRLRLNEVNGLLNEHIKELSMAHSELETVNKKLQLLNEQLKSANSQLRESNYVKEEYIGYVFALCSNYISKLDGFRRDINRKIKANKFEEVKSLTNTPSMAQNELKEFYHNFDAIFLHVYPDFVKDFNALLQPEERIVLKDGDLLNTELRIYALVRLGINDSVKIAEFLHCSPQTVYNNRLKARNKAIIPKEQFADAVRSLGKMDI